MVALKNYIQDVGNLLVIPGLVFGYLRTEMPFYSILNEHSVNKKQNKANTSLTL